MKKGGTWTVYLSLSALAVASFWLSPDEEHAPPPNYSVALHSAEYARAGVAGTDQRGLRLSAERIEYHGEAARLFQLRFWQQTADGSVELHGVRGNVTLGEAAARQFEIEEVSGEITGGGRRLLLQADNVSYDTASGEFRGEQPRMSDRNALLRGGSFTWHPETGLRLEGDVRSVYQSP